LWLCCELEAAFTEFETAYAAWDANDTEANCILVNEAIASFGTMSENTSEDCVEDNWSEEQTTNYLGWALTIAFSFVPEDCTPIE